MRERKGLTRKRDTCGLCMPCILSGWPLWKITTGTCEGHSVIILPSDHLRAHTHTHTTGHIVDFQHLLRSQTFLSALGKTSEFKSSLLYSVTLRENVKSGTKSNRGGTCDLKSVSCCVWSHPFPPLFNLISSQVFAQLAHTEEREVTMTPIVCVKGDDEVMRDFGPSQVKVQITGRLCSWLDAVLSV